MTVQPLPDSIVIWDIEREYVDPELDLAYIAGAAQDSAAILSAGHTLEINYQPGDGTRYGLVIVPLAHMEYARPRVKDGIPWGRHAVSGVSRRAAHAADNAADYYSPDSYLVCWVDHACYPLILGSNNVIASDYIAEHWKPSLASAVSLALLLRAINFELASV